MNCWSKRPETIFISTEEMRCLKWWPGQWTWQHFPLHHRWNWAGWRVLSSWSRDDLMFHKYDNLLKDRGGGGEGGCWTGHDLHEIKERNKTHHTHEGYNIIHFLIWRSTNAVRLANDPYTFMSIKKVVKYFFLYASSCYTIRTATASKNQTR